MPIPGGTLHNPCGTVPNPCGTLPSPCNTVPNPDGTVPNPGGTAPNLLVLSSHHEQGLSAQQSASRLEHEKLEKEKER